MPKRYKTARELNKMVHKLETRVLYTDSETGEAVTLKSPTRKSISDLYATIINQKTGEFREYDDAKAYVSAVTKGTISLTKQSYKGLLEEFQDSPIYSQLTIRGNINYEMQKIDKILNNDSVEYEGDINFSMLSKSKLIELISRAGREAEKIRNNIKDYNNGDVSRYDSTVFYDLLIEEYQKMLEETERYEI